jgi:hypothetical protein
MPPTEPHAFFPFSANKGDHPLFFISIVVLTAASCCLAFLIPLYQIASGKLPRHGFDE